MNPGNGTAEKDNTLPEMVNVLSYGGKEEIGQGEMEHNGK
jgi:hypothetical protein